MEYRKIISFGKGSYIVSLPKSWINRNRLNKGHQIGVDEGHDRLTLFANNEEARKKEEKRTTVVVDNKEVDLLRSEIITAYLNNYDIIEVMSKNPNASFNEIKAIIRDLTGFEVVEQTSTRLVAKDIMDIQQLSVNNIIRRMDVITRAMIQDCIECIEKKCSIDDFDERDKEVNRLHFLAYRLIRNALLNPSFAKTLSRNPWELQCDKSIVMRLEKIADRQKRIARFFTKNKLDNKGNEELKRLYKLSQERFLQIMKAYYTNNIKLAYDIEITSKDISKELEKFLLTHTHSNISGKDLKFEQKKCSFRSSCTSTALIIENLKAMNTSVKYIARTVMGGE